MNFGRPFALRPCVASGLLLSESLTVVELYHTNTHTLLTKNQSSSIDELFVSSQSHTRNLIATKITSISGQIRVNKPQALPTNHHFPASRANRIAGTGVVDVTQSRHTSGQHVDRDRGPEIKLSPALPGDRAFCRWDRKLRCARGRLDRAHRQ